jgi:hypothetical protein
MVVESPENTDDVQKTIAEASASPPLIRLRTEVGKTMGNGLCRVGRLLHAHGNIIGTGRIDGTSTRGNGDDEVVAVGALLQISGELALPSVRMLSTGEHYAGAALVRQIVEVEYLMWAFASNRAEAAKWLNSTREERHRFFRPTRLRDMSNGRFKHKDYEHHCEMGGHPVPRSLSLIGGANNPMVQVIIIDVLLHGWRTIDSAFQWAEKKGLTDAVHIELTASRGALNAWSKEDPLYAATEGPSPG